jgi:hypothetical protein
MKGITIQDFDDRNILSVDLKDILHLFHERLMVSNWRVSNVVALGGTSADELHIISDTNSTVGGQRLLELAEDVWQVTEGQFEAFLENATSPWCVIRAVDSSAYDVETDDDSMLEELRRHYKNVSEIPD